MKALGTLPVEQLASALKTRLESSLCSGQIHGGFPLSTVLAIEESLTKAILAIRHVKNTFALVNKLPTELLASIVTSVNDPLGVTADRTDLRFICIQVCRHWRNSLLAFPGVWSSVDTGNSRHMNFYLAMSKEVPLHVNYEWTTPSGAFERHIIPNRHRLRSLSIPLNSEFHLAVSKSLIEPSESLRTLNIWMSHTKFSVPADTMKAISRFAQNITVLKLHDITRNLSSLEFPALVKLTFRITAPDRPNPLPLDLINFLKHSPLLEDLDLCLHDHPGGGGDVCPSAGAVEFVRLKSAVFCGSLFNRGNSICINGLPYLILPKRCITVDVQVQEVRPSSLDPSPLLSATQLGDTIFPRQSITAAVIHIKDHPNGFFGHASVCGDHDNWIGLNYVQTPDPREGLLWRFRKWFDPISLTPLREIQTLTLGFFEFASDEEQCIEVLRTFLRELDQVRVLKVYRMDLILLARILQPSDKVAPLPSLEELKIYTCNPPELTRCAAHDNVYPGPSKETKPLRAEYSWESLKEARRWLRKAFLGTIREKDIDMCHSHLRVLRHDMWITTNHLKDSMIVETLRDIASMGDIPRQEELRLQEKAEQLIRGWSWRFGGYAESSSFNRSGNMIANSPVLHDMLRARKRCTEGVGGISKDIVVSASGTSTPMALPYS